MNIEIPELSLVALVGPSGAGKTTFAARHFKRTEVLSSDVCRGLVADDENAQHATGDAFAVLHFIAAKRLAAGRLTVVDATSVRPEDRKPLIQLARTHHAIPTAIVFNLPVQLCAERNASRPDRSFGPHVVRQQLQALRRSLRWMRSEGWRHVFVLESPEEVDAAVVTRTPLWNNRTWDSGPFDIIGDVHGCFDELAELLTTLGYQIEREADGAAATASSPTPARWSPGRRFGFRVVPPPGRKAVFLGDLVDRGPKIPEVLRLAMSMVADGSALCVPGNHDIKLVRKLCGRDVQLAHGLAESITQLSAESPEFRDAVIEFLDTLVSHYVLDAGRLVVAHAGMKAELQGRGSGAVRDFALYGETTGESDEFGLPVRTNWAADYRGRAMVVYGHTPVPEPQWLNHTINVDTGCVYGGRLTALRYPERELVSVPATQVYAVPRKPIAPAAAAEGSVAPALSAQHTFDDVLDIADISGKRILSTRLQQNITIREQHASAALEVMSRFAINPKWLIYLPPTMSPCETSRLPDLLEHPAEALAYHRHEGVPAVVCQRKHMGSRAVVIAARDEATVRRKFGLAGEGAGIIYTRTGRRFFDDQATEAAVLERICVAMDRSGLWDELKADWVCLDCELMPWSAKAQALLQQQYAAVGAAALAALEEANRVLAEAQLRGAPVVELAVRFKVRAESVAAYTRVYRHYCWDVASAADLRLAPFHLLASEGRVHVDRDHGWHMQTLARLADGDATGVLMATDYRMVDLTDPASEQAVTAWWTEMTAAGGEGMVVKPHPFVARGQRGVVQPAIKCRGREYLRIIYGPEYTAPEHLERLRARGVAGKRSLALREFALGVEALERFVRGEPLRRVHECVFGVLALESEPIDPRL